jgi:alpha-L-fucosidase
MKPALMTTMAAAFALLTAPAAMAEDHALVLTGVGRFAIFADAASVTPDGDGVRMRSLQVSEADMVISGVAYSGGWSWWRFDCTAQMADRLDFASLRADGTEGPIAPENAPPYAVAPGGDAAELAAVACRTDRHPADVTSAADAVKLGQALLSGEAEDPR